MKKSGGKLILSAMIASAMICASAVSAGAIDYGPSVVPNTPLPVQNNAPGTSASYESGSSSGSGKTDAVAGSSAATATTVLTDDAVDDILEDAANKGKTSVTVYMKEDGNGKATIQESAIAEIKKSNLVVTVSVQSNSGIDYSVTIDPRLITTAKAINLAMEITAGTPRDASISGVEIPQGSVVIEPAQKGSFGMTLTVNLPAGSLDGMRLGKASLFYISDNGNVTEMKDAITVYTNGSASVAISHASAYVISDLYPSDNSTDGYDDEVVFYDDEDDIIVETDFDDDDDISGVFVDGLTDDDDDVVTIISAMTDDDDNPHTGVTLAVGALAASAAAVVLTTKKRK